MQHAHSIPVNPFSIDWTAALGKNLAVMARADREMLASFFLSEGYVPADAWREAQILTERSEATWLVFSRSKYAVAHSESQAEQLFHSLSRLELSKRFQ